MGKDSIILYTQQYEAIKSLSPSDKGLLLDAIFQYHIDGIIPSDLPPVVKMAFSFIRTSIDIDNAKYLKKCAKNKENANKRWDADNANASNGMRTDAMDADTDNRLPITDNRLPITDNPKGYEKFSFGFLDEKFHDLFFQWLTHKSERREKYKTQDSIELCYRQLKEKSNNDPATAKKIVEQSIGNNWAGLFDLKNTGQKPVATILQPKDDEARKKLLARLK